MKHSHWPVVRLGEIAEFRNGLNYNKGNFGKGLKVINVKDFQDRLIADFTDLEEINPDGLIRDECLIRDGDILFVRSNGNRELIGRSMLVTGVKEAISHSAFSIKARFT
jgi:type I restriction enzyme, S subunit